jgi:hypothetical protein
MVRRINKICFNIETSHLMNGQSISWVCANLNPRRGEVNLELLNKWASLGVKKFKICVYVPLESVDKVRFAAGNAGAGVIGAYKFCVFMTKGVGSFLPVEGACPAIGEVGEMENVEEMKLEMVCDGSCLEQVVDAIELAHPYEEVAFDVYPMLSLQ